MLEFRFLFSPASPEGDGEEEAVNLVEEVRQEASHILYEVSQITYLDSNDPRIKKGVWFSGTPVQDGPPAGFGLCLFKDNIDLRAWSWVFYYNSHMMTSGGKERRQLVAECHMKVVEVVDEFRQRGVICEVRDLFGYWDKRDKYSLLHTIEAFDELSAGLYALLRKTKVGDAIGYVSSIPEFERLEAKSLRKLRDKLLADGYKDKAEQLAKEYGIDDPEDRE